LDHTAVYLFSLLLLEADDGGGGGGGNGGNDDDDDVLSLADDNETAPSLSRPLPYLASPSCR
jgi:hypothetical protein